MNDAPFAVPKQSTIEKADWTGFPLGTYCALTSGAAQRRTARLGFELKREVYPWNKMYKNIR